MVIGRDGCLLVAPSRAIVCRAAFAVGRIGDTESGGLQSPPGTGDILPPPTGMDPLSCLQGQAFVQRWVEACPSIVTVAICEAAARTLSALAVGGAGRGRLHLQRAQGANPVSGREGCLQAADHGAPGLGRGRAHPGSFNALFRLRMRRCIVRRMASWPSSASGARGAGSVQHGWSCCRARGRRDVGPVDGLYTHLQPTPECATVLVLPKVSG